MAKDQAHTAETAVEVPRFVARGFNSRLMYMGIDSLYLVIEYPKADVFQRWMTIIGDLDTPALKDGVLMGDTVVRRGVHGYKFSLWQGDARLFLTDRVEDNLAGTAAEGQGMGALLQLGPKWLQLYGNTSDFDDLRQHIHIQLMLFGMTDAAQYPTRINRLDFAMDVGDVAVADMSVEAWQACWVGRASLVKSYYASDSGVLTSFDIGTRQGRVSLSVYNKRLESEKDGDSGFWRSVWDITLADDLPITRFEWSIKCYEAKFADFHYLADMTFKGLTEVVNYVSTSWGRLCIPQRDTHNTTRWPLAPLWNDLRRFIDEWSNHQVGFKRPTYELRPDLKEAYIHSAVGWMAGFQARLGIQQHYNGPASLAEVLMFLTDLGFSLDEIERIAGEKWKKLSTLADSTMEARGYEHHNSNAGTPSGIQEVEEDPGI